MRRAPLSLLLGLGAALAACASPSPGPLPADLPPDFRLEVTCREARNPHCDYDVAVEASGAVAYAILHRGRVAADRRGSVEAGPGDLRDLWQAVRESGLLELPPRLPPAGGQEDRGVVVYRLRAAGRRAEVRADRAGTAGLDGVLRALYRVVPWRAWQVPSAAAP